MSDLIVTASDRDIARLIITVDRARQTPDGADPVLMTLTHLADVRTDTNLRIRAVVAYARTAVRPRPYRLADLADALGMSVSGVRSAYDEHDVRAVAAALRDRN